MLQGVGCYRVTRVTDKELLTTAQNFALMHSICAMQENQHKSVEELRFEAYAKAGEPPLPGESPGGAFSQPSGGATPFGASPTSAFGGGATPGGGLFGAGASSSPLGGTGGGSFATPGVSSSPFGATTSAFGAGPGAANPFGAATPGPTSAFGAVTPGAFGASPLSAGGSLFGGGAATVGAFGAPTSTPSFASATPSSAFGGSQSVGGGGLFGASQTISAFGGAASAPPNPFGATPTPAFSGATSKMAFGGGATTPAFGGSGAFGAPSSMQAFGGSSLGGGSTYGAPASTQAFGAAASTPTFAGGAFGAPGSTLGFGTSTSTPTFGGGCSIPGFGATQGMPSFSASPTGAANPFGATASSLVSTFGTAASPLGGASTFGGAATGGVLFGSTAPSAASIAAFGAVAASTPAFSTTQAISPVFFGETGASRSGAGLSFTSAAGSTPAFSFSPASTTVAGGGLFGATARPATNYACGTSLTSTSLFGGTSAVSPGLGAAMTPSLFGGAPMTSSMRGGGLGGIGGTTPGLLGESSGVSSLAMTAAAALPNVNASPYGDSLAMPAPAASPAASGPPPQKKSMLGGPSHAGIHLAFPVRSLTPRSPWLTSRGGLTPRMKPRGNSASPLPGGSDLGNYSGGSAASGGGGGTPSQMVAAGDWMFKPRENPRNLFIRPEPTAPSPLASLVATSPANFAYPDSSGANANNGDSGHRGRMGKHGGTPERRHVHFEDKADNESLMFAHKTADGINGVDGNATTEDVLPVISTQDGYSMEPSQEVLRMLVEEKGEQVLASTEDFVVIRENFGSVKWLEPVDIRCLEIDRVVRIERGVVYVYHENCGLPSPPPGEGLKKRAEVTLYECRPKKSGEAARAKYEERVLKQTRHMGGDLLEYNAETGVWRFALQL